MMVVATATLAHAEADGMSPDNDDLASSVDLPSPMTSSIIAPAAGDEAGLIHKPSPRRPTSLAIAVGASNHHHPNQRSRAVSAAYIASHHVATRGGASKPGAKAIADVSVDPLNINGAKSQTTSATRISAFSAYASTRETHQSNSNHFQNARNVQSRSSLQAAAMASSRLNGAKPVERSTSAVSRHQDLPIRASSTTVETACFTSLVEARGRQEAPKPANADESLEYASVTYRYLKQMDAKNHSKSNGKVPSFARSMISLNEHKNSGGPDDSIVSVPCPQPSSECPTPAAIRTSLRRRHSDLNLSSIANFLRTRFSRHDDTIDPKKAAENGSSSGDDLDDLLKRKFKGRSSADKRPNNENSQAPNSARHQPTPMHSTSAKAPCPHCSHTSAAYRRPCFRCRNRFIDVILESDATEV